MTSSVDVLSRASSAARWHTGPVDSLETVDVVSSLVLVPGLGRGGDEACTSPVVSQATVDLSSCQRMHVVSDQHACLGMPLRRWPYRHAAGHGVQRSIPLVGPHARLGEAATQDRSPRPPTVRGRQSHAPQNQRGGGAKPDGRRGAVHLRRGALHITCVLDKAPLDVDDAMGRCLRVAPPVKVLAEPSRAVDTLRLFVLVRHSLYSWEPLCLRSPARSRQGQSRSLAYGLSTDEREHVHGTLIGLRENGDPSLLDDL